MTVGERTGRESRIIQGLLAICLIAGFACFAFILFPEQLKKARAQPHEGQKKSIPTNLAAIIPLDSPSSQTPPPSQPAGGNIARFVPDAPPPSPSGSGNAGAKAIADNDDEEVAGGAGAAIDEAGFEARQARLASSKNPAAKDPPQNEADLAVGDPYGNKAPSSSNYLNTSLPPEFKAFPISSLTRRDPSSLDQPKVKQKKPWLVTPPGLEADVAFWKDIYAKYDRNKVVLHNPRNLKIIYDVVDLLDIENDPRLTDIEREHLREKRVDDRKKEITDILLSLSQGMPGTSLSSEEIRIKKLFGNSADPSIFKQAAVEDGVRAQLGQRDKFIVGLKYSGRYLGEIESIFESYGMPRELTRLIFVESMFNLQARSSVGASGIWQFMPGTGRIYNMRVNDLMDERNDPITATHAAARLLRHDYDVLGEWPLAINAYNAGRGRMMQAISRMGTSDIGRIIKGFSHPAYGFASRNFFLEFLAVLDVAEHAEQHFGPIDFDKPLRYETVRVNYNILLPDVAKIANISLDELFELNPALNSRVINGARPIPMGFSMRVPEKKGEIFLAAASRAPESRSGPLKHVVKDGETLATIADMYGISQQSILHSNKDITRRLRPGQMIMVPVDGK